MNLLYDFTVDQETATIHITRAFDAEPALVWDAFTRSELLEQWMAPAPMKVLTKIMDFRVGGRWQYGMVPPEPPRFWSLVEFLEIDPLKSFVTRNSFCNENGQPAEMGFTHSITRYDFVAGEQTTTVKIAKKMGSMEELERFISIGFREGMAAVLLQLENILRRHQS